MPSLCPVLGQFVVISGLLLPRRKLRLLVVVFVRIIGINLGGFGTDNEGNMCLQSEKNRMEEVQRREAKLRKEGKRGQLDEGAH